MANDSRPSPGRPKRYTHDALIDAVRAAAGGRYLSLLEYDRWCRQHDSPSSRTVCRRLGPRWPTVLENAGIPRQTFQDRTARGIAALQDLWRELGYRPSYLDWQRWRGKPRGSKTIWRHFGSWVNFRDAALRADPNLRQHWSRSWAVRRLLAIPDAMLTPREWYLAACLRQGMTLRAAGETLGITRQRVYQLARAAGCRYDSMPPISSQPSNAGSPKQTRVTWYR